jgi:hypothetical protein
MPSSANNFLEYDSRNVTCLIKVLKIVRSQKGIKPSPRLRGEGGPTVRLVDEGTPGNRIQPGPHPSSSVLKAVLSASLPVRCGVWGEGLERTQQALYNYANLNI